jgi:hypothetical protein
LKKLSNGGWTEQDAALLREDLASYRTAQKKNIVIAAWCLRFAHFCLAVGAVVTVICFGLVLFSLKSTDRPASKSVSSAAQGSGRLKVALWNNGILEPNSHPGSSHGFIPDG